MMLMERKVIVGGARWAGEKEMKDDGETTNDPEKMTSEKRCAEKLTWKRGWAGTKYPWSRFRSLVGTVTRRS